MIFDEWSYIFTQDRDSLQGESRRYRGLAGLALTAQRNCLSPDTYGAGMECQDTPASQNKSHDRPQEIRRHILIGERRWTGSPNTFRCTIHKEAGFIAIGQLEELSPSVRSKRKWRAISFDFSGPWVLHAGGQTPGFSHAVRLRTETHNNVIPFKMSGF